MANVFEHNDRFGQSLRVGDSVLVGEIPVKLLEGLLPEDQEAIRAQKGNCLTVEGFDDYGNVELEFTDASEQLHTIWIESGALEKLSR